MCFAKIWQVQPAVTKAHIIKLNGPITCRTAFGTTGFLEPSCQIRAQI